MKTGMDANKADEALRLSFFAARDALNKLGTVEYSTGGPAVEALKAKFFAAKKALRDFQMQFYGASEEPA